MGSRGGGRRRGGRLAALEGLNREVLQGFPFAVTSVFANIVSTSERVLSSRRRRRSLVAFFFFLFLIAMQ